MTLKHILTTDAEKWREVFAMSGRPDRNGSFGAKNVALEFIAEYGTDFKSAPYPKDWERGEPRLCYMNAYKLAESHGLNYVEGFGLSANLAKIGLTHFPVEHAWCVDDDGKVYDPTWDDPTASAYRGVIIPRDLLHEEMRRLKRYGALHTMVGTNIRLIKKLEREMTPA
jgi:hypothetical protein